MQYEICTEFRTVSDERAQGLAGNKAILYSPLFSGNVYTTLNRGCSDIGLDHRTETLQYQLESITGTTNIPRRERGGQNTVLYDSLDIQFRVVTRRLTECTCFSAKTSTQVKLT